MKKILFLAILSIVCLTLSAQDSQGKFPIYVLPEAMTDDGSTDLDVSQFASLVKNTKAEVNQYAKSYATNNLQDAAYVVGVFIDGSEPSSQSIRDPKTYETITEYSIKVTYTLAISPADQPEKIISAIGPYPADLTSFKSYDDAFAHNTLYPEHGRIRELLESALSVGAEVTKVEAEKKHADKADRAWVNVGKDHGILDTQWFDVYTLDANGNQSSKPIGSLHAAEVGANETECTVKDGEKEIMTAYKAGTKMVVQSREEKNAWKGLGRILDKARVILR